MNIAIYTRKSKFTGKGESIENQIKRCKKFIDFKFNINTENVEIFIDEGFTGRNENRPKYKELINKVKKGEINHIILYQLNRFGRNARDIHNALQECIDHNCIIYSAQEGFDSKTSFGRAIMGIMASLAQLETEQIGERVGENMYNLARMGRWLGGQSPLGFNGTREIYIDENGRERSITKLTPNSEELKLVKIIFEKYLEEKSLSQVSKWSLTNHFKGKNGGNLNKSAINTILQNPAYLKSSNEVLDYLNSIGYEVCGKANGNGILRYGKKDERIAAIAKHKGIIDANDWLKVQQILKENTEKAPRMGKTNTALLTGILKCNCGSGMRVTYGHVNKDGVRPFYYTCTMKNDSGGTRCTSKNINGLILEKKLIEHLKVYDIKNFTLALNKMINESNELDKNINVNNKNIDNELKNTNNSIKKLLNSLKQTDDKEVQKIILDEITLEKNKLKTLEKEKNKVLDEQPNLIELQNNLLNIVSSLTYFNDNFDLLSIDEKQKQLRLMFESIVYKNEKFHLNFNIKKKLDNSIIELSRLSDKYNSSHIGTSRFSMSNKKTAFFSSTE
ncbi:recombinase family protein [Clostridium botulinum]|nr:recombinase family protein [Clostridium botulinum]